MGGVGEDVFKRPGHLASEKTIWHLLMTLLMHLASLAFIMPYLQKKIEMTGIVTRTYPKSAPETYYTFTRKKISDSFDSNEK